jgi:hypothetical protein
MHKHDPVLCEKIQGLLSHDGRLCKAAANTAAQWEGALVHQQMLRQTCFISIAQKTNTKSSNHYMEVLFAVYNKK